MEIDQLPWADIHTALQNRGFAHLPQLIGKEDCLALQALYPQPHLFRSIINMQCYRFGQGEYKYFGYPLPHLIQQLRQSMYAHLAPLANAWMRSLQIEMAYPPDHATFLQQCHAFGQARPTPLLLQYQTGGFNTLHQDLYGNVYFPFQVAIALSQHGHDYEGGAWVLTEQVPRAQSKAHVIAPQQGDAMIFTTNFRPVLGQRGYYRAHVRHGVSEVTRGHRYVLGVIFHDAQ